jgi:DNA-binding transcriptional ArsR family regulator
MLDAYFEMPYLGQGTDRFQSTEQALRSADDYVEFLIGRFGEEFINSELERRAYAYIVDPAAMQTLIVSHLRMMWERFLASEWRRVQPILGDAETAFAAAELSNMPFAEAFQFVTGQQLADMNWPIREGDYSRYVFVPSAHAGPYLGKFHRGSELFVFFGARLPAGSTINAPDLSRGELVVLLNALADDTRLRILRYVADNGEQRSQRIMADLGLSQSTASRQLSHLCAAGFLRSRLCDGAKCYSLSADRLRDTVQAVLAFLAISPTRQAM